MSTDDPGHAAADDYPTALGLAVYAWARLEWEAVRCCDCMDPGSIDSLEDRTAGRIADTLGALARRMPHSPHQRDLLEAASRFAVLVRTRNNLFHAKPGLNSTGQQRLFRSGDEWEIEELENVARAFRECEMKLGSFRRAF